MIATFKTQLKTYVLKTSLHDKHKTIILIVKYAKHLMHLRNNTYIQNRKNHIKIIP